MEPDIFRDIDRAGEAGPVIDLPVGAGIENRRVLHGVGQPGLVLAEINPFAVGAVFVETKLKAEKTAVCRGCDIDINNPVAHFKVFQNRRCPIQQEALAALIFSHLGVLQVPARRVRRHGECLRRLGIRSGRKKKSQSTKSEVSHCFRFPVEDGVRF